AGRWSGPSSRGGSSKRSMSPACRSRSARCEDAYRHLCHTQRTSVHTPRQFPTPGFLVNPSTFSGGEVASGLHALLLARGTLMERRDAAKNGETMKLRVPAL